MGKYVGYEKRFVFAAMKLKHLILFLAMFLAACSSRHPDPVETRLIASLQAIDSLMWRQPDSALMVLIDFAGGPQADSLSAFDGHYCQLLLSELLYKNDHAQTNREELLKAVDYFDSIVMSDGRDADGKDAINRVSTDIVFLDARAHYIKGVGFYENDSVVEACAEYLKALEVMENRFDDKDLTGHYAKFMSLTYNRLADLFSGQFMTEPAIDCFKKSIHFCKIEPTSKYGISKSYSFIGKQYDMMEKYDSASIYYRLALEELPDRDNIAYRDLFSIIVIHNHYSKKSNVESSIDSMRMIAAQAATEAERMTRLLTLGALFNEAGQYDSAAFYLENVYKNEEDIESKIQAAELLKKQNATLGKKADEYDAFLSKHTMKEYGSKAKVSRLDNMYQSHLQKGKDRMFTKEKHSARKKVAYMIIPIVLLTVFAVFAITRKLGRKRISEHKLALERTEATLSEIKMKLDMTRFADEPICKNILEVANKQQFKSKIDYLCYKDYALRREQLIELREAANLHYDNFTTRLKNRFPKMTNDDIDYCCLYLLGLKDSDVSAFMQKDYSTVRYRSNKIKSILNTEKNLTEALYNMASI